MNKFILTACLGMSIIGAGCAAQKEVKYVEVPQTTAYVAPPVVSKEDTFVALVNSEYPSFMSRLGGRSELVRFGNLVCQAIDEGSTLADFALIAVDTGVEPEMLGFVMGASIMAFCPENEWFMNQTNA